MTAKELDIVLLKDGREATILEVFDHGSAFMVEVADNKGKTIDMPTVKQNDIEKIIYKS